MHTRTTILNKYQKFINLIYTPTQERWERVEIDDKVVFDTLQENILAIASVESLDYQTYEIAFNIRQKYNISYWDSLVIASALQSGCDTLYSEDMQDGLILENGLRVVNPF